MNFVPVPIIPSSITPSRTATIRSRLREHVDEHCIKILDSRGREINLDDLLDEALGPELTSSKAGAMIGLLLALGLAVWIVIVLFVWPG